MKCVNCGAEVIGDTCEYCGTHYYGKSIIGTFENNDHSGILKVGDIEYNVYISLIEIDTFFRGARMRDEKGRIIEPAFVKKRRFTLVEL